MEYNFKRTFDAVNMSPEKQEQTRLALSSRCRQRQEEEKFETISQETPIKV